MFDEGEAINLVRLADAEMVAGNNIKARSLYEKAGDILSQCPKDVTSKNAVLYSAAVVYCKGCFYVKAMDVLRRITEKTSNITDLVKFTKSHIGISDDFIRTDYLTLERAAANPRVLLDILIDNPFIFPPKTMAMKRSCLLRMLGMNEEAALFLEDAKHLEDKDSLWQHFTI